MPMLMFSLNSKIFSCFDLSKTDVVLMCESWIFWLSCSSASLSRSDDISIRPTFVQQRLKMNTNWLSSMASLSGWSVYTMEHKWCSLSSATDEDKNSESVEWMMRCGQDREEKSQSILKQALQNLLILTLSWNRMNYELVCFWTRNKNTNLFLRNA